jgi:peptidoglycan/xylan/chitin deacetylase (PgdA/CDA1 family)
MLGGMTHGIMFHHFHSSKHAKRPGSISASDLDSMISYLKDSFSILSPDEFIRDVENGRLNESSIVLTFDDALLSQFDVALPVLESHGIHGIFSIYSSVFGGKPDPLEIFAAFRQSNFGHFDEFFVAFERAVLTNATPLLGRRDFEYPVSYLAEFPFYSDKERNFRYLRDEVLGPEIYSETMWTLIKQSEDFDLDAEISALWMTTGNLKVLRDSGHHIGMHSHTHPTRMDFLSESEQRGEYETNHLWIVRELDLAPSVVAHPCGRYSEATLKILSDLGARIGFRSSLTDGPFGTALEIPREDHANVYREMVAA